MGLFALDAAAAFRRGSARGERSQISSMGITCSEFMSPFGDAASEAILGQRAAFESRRREGALLDGSGTHAEFKIARLHSDPKRRWVDGTPEYSFEICGLRKLFPAARFVHILRDCDSVALSMFHFERTTGIKLVNSLAHAYELWMKYVRACVAAERAYGPTIVCRQLFDDLRQEPSRSMERLLKFIGEPPSSSCVEPLGKKINSSLVTEKDSELTTFVEHSEEARRLWEELRDTRQADAPSSQEAELLENEFERRVDHELSVNERLDRMHQANTVLQRELKERTQWALRSKEELEETRLRLLRLQEAFDARTKWALSLKKEVEQLQKPKT